MGNSLDETYLHLRLSHSQRVGELGPLRTGKIFGLFERLFQRENLLAAERWSRVLLLAVFVELLVLLQALGHWK